MNSDSAFGSSSASNASNINLGIRSSPSTLIVAIGWPLSEKRYRNRRVAIAMWPYGVSAFITAA